MLTALLDFAGWRSQTPRRPVPATATRPPEGPVVQETAPAAAVTTPPVTTGYAPPLSDGSIDAGICWHNAHVIARGQRYGVTPIGRDDVIYRAALTRCRFVNPDGR